MKINQHKITPGDTVTLREACKEYVDLLNSPPNGWGQHVHPIYGQSHNLLLKLWKDWGQKEVEDCLQTIWLDRGF